MWNDLIIIRLGYEIIPNEKIRYQHFYGKYNYQIQTLEYRQGQFEMYFIFYFVIRFVISLFSTSSHLKMTVKMIFPLLQHGRNVSLILYMATSHLGVDTRASEYDNSKTGF